MIRRIETKRAARRPARDDRRGTGQLRAGEWTDDTAQTYAIAKVAATGADLRDEAALDAIAQEFLDWYASSPPDVGVHTSGLFRAVGRRATAAQMRAELDAIHVRAATGRRCVPRRWRWRT